MGMVPDKFKRYPFVVWGMILATALLAVLMFGPDNVWELILEWARPGEG